MSREFRNVGNPFQQTAPSVAEVDAQLYGSVDLPASGRVVSRPIDIMHVRADIRQPRRAVPAVVRLHWDGRANVVQKMLEQWHEIAEKRSGFKLDPVMLIAGKGEGIDELDQAPAVAQEYVALCRLAQSIQKEGLINPISVIERGSEYLIETGERRWLAYHLLEIYFGKQFAQIPARISDGRDYIWRQAQENTARRSLNAISMARQLALLIMDARRDVDGVKYDEYEDLVLNGECDRRYYAQIANGNIHRIPRGMGERIEAAMGLSKHRIAQYRNLLRLTDDDGVNDALWTKADVEDWSEKAIREIVSTIPVEALKPVVKREEWTVEELRAEVDRLTRVNLSPKVETPSASKWIAETSSDKAVSVPQVGTMHRAPTQGMAPAPTQSEPVSAGFTPSPLHGDGNKAPVVAAIPGSIGGRRLLDEGDDRWRLLAAIESLVVMLGDNDLANDLVAVRNLTSARVREQRGTILDYLQRIYDGVTAKFASASSGLDEYFAEIEQMIQELSEE